MATRILVARRALGRGYRAWTVGDLERSETELRAAIEARPTLRGAAYFLSRVLSEQGQPVEGVATLDRIPAAAKEDEVRGIFRTLIAYDSGDLLAARHSVASLPRTNAIAGALGPLCDLRERLGGLTAPSLEPVVAPLPVAARWIADVAGRALAVLEEASWRVLPAEALSLHHAYYAGSDAPRGPGAEGKTGEPPAQADPAAPTARPSAPAPAESRKGWESQIEEAFRSSRFELVEELCRRNDVPEAWKGPDAEIYRAFSLLALGKEARALEGLARRARGGTLSPEAHFLVGLCHARSGRIAPAGWAFARAARSMDILCDEIVQKTSRLLNVTWTYEDR